MNKIAAGLISGCALLSACTTPIVKEVRYPGGYPGHLLDKRTFDASNSKSVQLLRATIIVAMAARMATATIRDGKDADAFADYLVAATTELNHSAANIYPSNNVAPCQMRVDAPGQTACAAYYANFEADMPLVETRVVRLILAALPENRARAFLEDVAKGDVLSASWRALRALAEVAGGLHRSAAVYRSGLEVAAAMKCTSTDYVQDTDTVKKAAACLGLPEEDLFDDEPTLMGSLKVREDAFHALLLIASTSCARLPLNTDQPIATAVSTRNSLCSQISFQPKVRSNQVPTS